LPISKPEELAQVSIEGATLKRLGDVADIVENHQPLIGDAIIDNSPNLMLIVEKFPWANTVEVTEELEDALEALLPALNGLKMDSTLFRPATYLKSAFATLSKTLLLGAVSVLIVLLVFLTHWRTALISAAAILLSAMAAITVLYLQGITFNLMVWRA
jgi:multidrug efflux pump subunit AcrB